MDTDENINFIKLQREFTTARIADEKYSRENSAKFRAVNQRVGSYEEFRDIVVASHLQPLDRKDILGMDQVQQSWNHLYHARSTLENVVPTKSVDKIEETVDSIDKFTKKWKTLKTSYEKSEFLMQFDKTFLEHVFFYEIPMNVLEDSVQSLLLVVSDMNYLKISEILHSFTRSTRFKLSLKFFANKDKQNITDLFMKLAEFGYDVTELRRWYTV